MLKKRLITLAEAICLLPDTGDIHTFRNISGGVLGMDLPRKTILKKLAKHKNAIELTGKVARGLGHGIGIYDNFGGLFIETEPAKMDAFEAVPETIITPAPVVAKPHKRTDYFVVWIEGLSLKGGEKICSLTATGYDVTTKMTEAMRFKAKDLPKLKSYLKRHGVADWVLSSANTFVKTTYTPKGTIFDNKTNAL